MKRKKLNNFRQGETVEVTINGVHFALTTNEFPNGMPGEIFITLKKHGSDLQTLINCFAMSVSLNLQYGAPLKMIIEKFQDVDFNPKGEVKGHPSIVEASSIIDFIFSHLQEKYLVKESSKTKKSA